MRAYPQEEHNQVSHETIYRSLFVRARGVLKKELVEHLRSQRTMRRSRHATGKGVDRGQIKDMVSISERPASVYDRTQGQKGRIRCVMIVALARNPAIALWRYLETGLIPEGAVVK